MLFKGFFSIFRSAGHFCSAEKNHFSNFGKGTLEEHFLCNYFEIGPLAWEETSFNFFSIFSSGGHFVQPSRTILAILVEGHSGNIPVKLS